MLVKRGGLERWAVAGILATTAAMACSNEQPPTIIQVVITPTPEPITPNSENLVKPLPMDIRQLIEHQMVLDWRAKVANENRVFVTVTQPYWRQGYVESDIGMRTRFWPDMSAQSGPTGTWLRFGEKVHWQNEFVIKNSDGEILERWAVFPQSYGPLFVLLGPDLLNPELLLVDESRNVVVLEEQEFEWHPLG